MASGNNSINTGGYWHYHNLKQGYVIEGGIRKAAQLISVRENTKECWERVGVPTENQSSVGYRIYEVRLTSDEWQTRLLDNLVYFFIRASRAKENNIKYGLLVTLENIADQFRLETYFSMFSNCERRKSSGKSVEISPQFYLLYRIDDRSNYIYRFNYYQYIQEREVQNQKELAGENIQERTKQNEKELAGENIQEREEQNQKESSGENIQEQAKQNQKESAEQTRRINIGNILPLIHVVRPDNVKFSGDISFGDLQSTQILPDEDKPHEIKEVTSQVNKNEIADQTNEEVCESDSLQNTGVKTDENEKDTSGSKISNSKESEAPLLKLSNHQIKQYLVYDKQIEWWRSVPYCCAGLLQQIGLNLKGTQGKGYRASQKEMILHQLADEIIVRRNHLSLLTELCWFYNLRILMEDKLLVDNGQVVISVLQKSYLDTITYADGLAQILENSCQHSQHHSAYLSMRILPVKRDDSLTDIQLSRNIKNRMCLIQAFQEMEKITKSDEIRNPVYEWKLEPRASYYLYASVIDDCYREENGVISYKGILDIYRENCHQYYEGDDEQENALPQFLYEVYTDSKRPNTSNTDSIIHHYGISAMKQLIINNGGVFLVLSPEEKFAKTESKVKHKKRVTHVVGVSKYSDEAYQKGYGDQTVYEVPSSTSEYHILFPLGMQEDLEESIGTKETPSLKWSYDPEYIYRTDVETIHVYVADQPITADKNSEKLGGIELTKLREVNNYLDQKTKIKKVQELCEEYRTELKKYSALGEKIPIVLFDLRRITDMQLELFAKFLFAHFLESNDSLKKRFAAVYFDNTLQEQEFLRLFAVFYDRVTLNLKNNIVNTQIALCNTHEELQIPQVNLVLNLGNWDILYYSARRYAYSNLDSSKDLYTQIRYFGAIQQKNSSQSDGEIKTEDLVECQQFPFELYLKENMDLPMDEGNCHISSSKDCWFMRRIVKYLNGDLQGKSFGIKISNVHAYLPSGVHLNAFYEAELLFHNISYVWQFAFLLARDIMKYITVENCKKKWMIVGYEAYSSLVEQYFTEYLREAISDKFKLDKKEIEIQHAAVYQERKGNLELRISPYFEAKNKDDWQYVVLFPIGTTLSTVNLIHRLIQKKFGVEIHPGNIKNVVMILLGNNAKRTGDKSLDEYYWERITEKESVTAESSGFTAQQDYISICDPLGRGGKSERARSDYFVIVDTEWHEPKICSGWDKESVMVHADSTSTELNMIFPPKVSASEIYGDENKLPGKDRLKQIWEKIHKHDVCSLMKYGAVETNDKRISFLSDCVQYGHLHRGRNHFAFYIDLPAYYAKLKGIGAGLDRRTSEQAQKEYSDWKKELSRDWKIRKRVQQNTFNIVVSPLRNDNSPLLKDLADEVFEHSIHILQVNLLTARRTDILAKYGFIAEEYRQICKSDPNAHIQVYYVDDSIVTGETLRRGLNLVKMLLSESGEKWRQPVYNGVYVLINRSSRDTVQTFVNDPDTDYHAFVHLAIPHYNTYANCCPTCERNLKFDQLLKHATTNQSVKAFRDLCDKNRLRTVNEYIQWQKDQIFSSARAYLQLREWIYARTIEGTSERTSSNWEKCRQQIVDVLQKLEMSFYEEFARENSIEAGEIVDILSKSDSQDLREQFLHALENETLGSRLQKAYGSKIGRKEYNDLKELFESVWIHHVLPDKAFERLESTHRAYSNICLEKEIINDNDCVQNEEALKLVEYHRQVYAKMYDMIYKFLQSCPGNSSNASERWERLHSDLKVLSRDYIARHHMVREIVFDILHQIIKLMQISGETDKTSVGEQIKKEISPEIQCIFKNILGLKDVKEFNSFSAQIHPLMKYQMYISVLNCLSNMESNTAILLLRQDKLSAIEDGMNGFDKIFFEKSVMSTTQECSEHTGSDAERIKRVKRLWYLCPIPTREKRIFDIEKCVKFSAMAEDENNKGVLVQSQISLKEGSK